MRRADEPGARVIDVARDFGVDARRIRYWRRRLEAEPDPAVRLAREEHAELVALRRRVRVLEEEREILAKAAAFIAREAGRTRVTAYRFVERVKGSFHLAPCAACSASPRAATGPWRPGSRRRGPASMSRCSPRSARSTRGRRDVRRAAGPRDPPGAGRRVGRKRVARLMSGAGLSASTGAVGPPRPAAAVAGRRDCAGPGPPSTFGAGTGPAVGRRHHLAPDREGFLNLARSSTSSPAGWSAGRWPTTSDGLVLAASTPRSPPARRARAVHHSDRGTSTRASRSVHGSPKPGSPPRWAPRDAYDNALAEASSLRSRPSSSTAPCGPPGPKPGRGVRLDRLLQPHPAPLIPRLPDPTSSRGGTVRDLYRSEPTGHVSGATPYRRTAWSAVGRRLRTRYPTPGSAIIRSRASPSGSAAASLRRSRET